MPFVSGSNFKRTCNYKYIYFKLPTLAKFKQMADVRCGIKWKRNKFSSHLYGERLQICEIILIQTSVTLNGSISLKEQALHNDGSTASSTRRT